MAGQDALSSLRCGFTGCAFFGLYMHMFGLVRYDFLTGRKWLRRCVHISSRARSSRVQFTSFSYAFGQRFWCFGPQCGVVHGALRARRELAREVVAFLRAMAFVLVLLLDWPTHLSF